MPRSTCSKKDDYSLQLKSFGSYSERYRNFRFVTTAGWPVYPPDVVWEMLINLLMKSGLLLSAISLRESMTLEGTPAFQMTSNTSCNESHRLHVSLSLLLSLLHNLKRAGVSRPRCDVKFLMGENCYNSECMWVFMCASLSPHKCVSSTG